MRNAKTFFLLSLICLISIQLNGAGASSSSAAPGRGASSSPSAPEEPCRSDLFVAMPKRELDFLRRVDPTQAFLYLGKYIVPTPTLMGLIGLGLIKEEDFQARLNFRKRAVSEEETEDLFRLYLDCKDLKEVAHVYLKFKLLTFFRILETDDYYKICEPDLQQFIRRMSEEEASLQELKVSLFIRALIQHTGKSVDFDRFKKERQTRLNKELKFLIGAREMIKGSTLPIIDLSQFSPENYPLYSCADGQVLDAAFKVFPTPPETIFEDEVASICTEIRALGPSEDDKGKNKAG